MSFCLCSMVGLGQYQLSGMIVDNNNAPLEGVSIYIPDLKTGTITNKEGNYVLRNLLTLTHSLQTEFSCLLAFTPS